MTNLVSRSYSVNCHGPVPAPFRTKFSSPEASSTAGSTTDQTNEARNDGKYVAGSSSSMTTVRSSGAVKPSSAPSSPAIQASKPRTGSMKATIGEKLAGSSARFQDAMKL